MQEDLHVDPAICLIGSVGWNSLSLWEKVRVRYLLTISGAEHGR
jgi:hypothetical protein